MLEIYKKEIVSAAKSCNIKFFEMNPEKVQQKIEGPKTFFKG